MKRKPDIGILITSIAFATAASAVIVALALMLADVHIWHKLMPRAFVAAAITGLAFLVSLTLHFKNAKSDRGEAAPDADICKACDTDTATEPTPKEKRRARAVKAFKIVTGGCFAVAAALAVAARFSHGFTNLLLLLFSTVAAFMAGASAVVAVILGRRSAAEKAALVSLISVPFILFAMAALVTIVFFGAMFYIMIVSWGQWGVI